MQPDLISRLCFLNFPHFGFLVWHQQQEWSLPVLPWFIDVYSSTEVIELRNFESVSIFFLIGLGSHITCCCLSQLFDWCHRLWMVATHHWQLILGAGARLVFISLGLLARPHRSDNDVFQRPLLIIWALVIGDFWSKITKISRYVC